MMVNDDVTDLVTEAMIVTNLGVTSEAVLE